MSSSRSCAHRPPYYLLLPHIQTVHANCSLNNVHSVKLALSYSSKNHPPQSKESHFFVKITNSYPFDVYCSLSYNLTLKVPAQETTYFCKTFKLPSDRDYHIVASEAVLDNTKVIHHMIIRGCSEDIEIEKEPFHCIMGSSRCKDILAAWTVGSEGL